MPKINQEEYEVLKELDDKWKWIARDNDTILWAYEKEPRKYEDCWCDLSDDCEIVDSDLFQFIQWEDEEPYYIAELIEEYENWLKDYEVDWDKVFGRESVEAEVKKDFEWLRNEINELSLSFLGFSMLKQREEFAVNKDDVMELIDQLDEPEVLSPDWISKNVEYAYFDMLDGSGRLSSATAIIRPEKLKNLLVPKQEEQSTETVADVVTTFWKSYERLKEVMSMEVEELEE